MNSREERILRNRMVPSPVAFRLLGGEPYLIKDGCEVRLVLDEGGDGLAEEARKLFKAYWQVKAVIRLEPASGVALSGPEATRITIASTSLALRAQGRPGVLHALKTLRQLAEPQRGVEKHAYHLLPACEIEDGPALAFRGVHLCFFPETEMFEIEKNLRLAAQYKFNHVVLECWGVFPFKSHPDFAWADRRVSRSALARLVRLAGELGVTLIPQFNLLGHASASRAMAGKHAVLDFDAARQSLFEPDGWSWCLTNPRTREILADLVAELHDFFDRPPFFHIGFDEADNLGTCAHCRTHETKRLVREHLLFFRELLAKRGARTILWHDMLVQNDDPRWKGYTACGLAEQELSELHRELPKDLILADWQYDFPSKDGEPPTWPTSRFFKEQGFPVIVCPWDHEGGIKSLGALARAEGLMGMLATTWHHHHDEDLCKIFHTAAKAAWERTPDWGTSHLVRRLIFAHHQRMAGWDMGVKQYRQTGSAQYQLPMHTWPGR